MKKIIIRCSAFLLLAMLLFANVTLTLDDTSFSVGGVIAAMAFGDDLPGEDGVVACYATYLPCSIAGYDGCKRFWRCNPQGCDSKLGKELEDKSEC